MSEGLMGRDIDLKCTGVEISGHIGKGILDTKVDLKINGAHFSGTVSRGITSFDADLMELSKGRKVRFSIRGVLRYSARLTVDDRQYEGIVSRDLLSRELELTASETKVESIRVERAVLGKNVYISRNNEIRHELCTAGEISKDIYFTPPIPNANKILIMLLFETYDQAMQESESTVPMDSSVPIAPGLPGMP